MEHVTETFARRAREILGDNLTGVYLHGSAVMGCFNPAKSDIDLMVVTEREVPDAGKRAFMEMVTALNAEAPAKGIEMSIVRRDVCDPFIYPTPFELHFSAAHLGWYKSDPEDYIRKMNGTDPDLAAHFTIIRARGKCLYGEPIGAVFGEVPAADYMDSIWKDIAGAAEDIGEDTLYLTLNLARVLAYKEEGLVLSKKEGGEWALSKLTEEYHPLIRMALSEYTEDADVCYDKALAERYAAFMLDRIQAP